MVGGARMTQSLFREEVLAARRNGSLGSIRLQAPRLAWVFVGVGVLAVTVIIGLLLGGHYTRSEQVSGSLVPSRGLLGLAPSSPGIVTRVLVDEGDVVRAGQPIVEISGEQTSSSFGDTDAAVATQLQIKRARLQADLGDQERLAGLQKKDLQSRIVLLREQIVQMEQQVKLQKQRAGSARALYDAWANLGNAGVVSKLQLAQQHDVLLQNLVQLKAAEGQTSQLRQLRKQLQGQVAQLPATVSVKRNSTVRALADVDQALAQNAARRSFVLRAPANGTVANILVHSGQTVIPQETLVTVLPSHSRLLAELWVPTKAIGFIRAGEPVVIRYHAFPYQKFGQHIGRVQKISRSAVSPKDVMRLVGENISDPRYRVEVALDAQTVLAYGTHEMLLPGMTLDADIQIDRRRLLEWVFEPLYGFARERPVDATETSLGAR